MYNRRYEKVFLMLRQEMAGYALGKRPPWGSCVMELKNGKGKLHLTVQGLKPLRNGSYGMYVMAGQDSIFCGELKPDVKEGHGELKWEFQPDAIGQGKCVEDFQMVILLAEDGKNGISAPLTAFFGEKRDWKKDFVPRKKTETVKSEEISLRTAEAAKLPPMPAVPVHKKQEEPKQPKQTHEKIAEEQKNSFHGSFQGLLAKFRQELEELEETGVLTAQETAHIRSIGEEKEENVVAAAEQEEKNDSLFAKNRELEPFGDGEKWKCISLEELTLLSQIPLKWQKEFFFLLPYRRYHHLIVQETEEGIWLGLPGFYSTEDEADAKAFGFGEFRHVDDDWGYWVSFLERDS